MARNQTDPPSRTDIAASLAAGRETVEKASQRIESASEQVLRSDALVRRVRARIEIREGAFPEQAALPPEADARDAVGPDGSASPRASVLLIDGHDDTRALYSHYLTAAGCAVDDAANGQDGFAKARAKAYEVIVTEVSLSSVDGFELCSRLRREPATMRTPLLVLTADAQQVARDRARAAGADAVLVKPCLPESLLAKIERLLGRRVGQQSQSSGSQQSQS